MERTPAGNVIIAGGSKPDLFECLLSLAELTYAPVETIVVDNSSGGLTDELAVAFPAVRVARAGQTLTFAQAANYGFRQALGRGACIVFLLNDDVTVHPEALAALADAESKSGPGIFAPEVWPYKSGQPRVRFRLDWGKRLIVSEHVTEGAAATLDYAEGSAVLVSAKVFETLGGFDENLGFYYEDADFSIRAAEAGFPVVEVSGARVWHKGSMSAGKGLSPFKAYWRARNALKFALKHRDRANIPANIAYHFAEFVIPQALKAMGRTLTGSSKDAQVLSALMRGTLDFLTGNGKAMRFRISGEVEPDGQPIALLREIL